ncbi:MAG: type II secretion system F family protein [Pseudomonadota bacterium]
MDFLTESINNGSLYSFVMALCIVVAILSIGFPLLDRSNLQSRMKSVSVEREKIRAQSRDLLDKNKKGSLRGSEAKPFIKGIVDSLKLETYFGYEELRNTLKMAGYRGEAPFATFLFFRLVMPVIVFLFALFYLFVVLKLEQSVFIKLGMAALAMYFGYQLPRIILSNKVQKRQQSIKRALPDSLDLLLICVEAGMAMEPALKKVADEIGKNSIPLAEELSLTLAELSYLSDRRMAFENLGNRTGMEQIRSISMALIQAEKYGTGLSQTLRVLAQENRDMRMLEAEKKAAGLPPKLTVPMILFFLPALFIIILGPAAIRVMDTIG